MLSEILGPQKTMWPSQIAVARNDSAHDYTAWLLSLTAAGITPSCTGFQSIDEWIWYRHRMSRLRPYSSSCKTLLYFSCKNDTKI